MKATPSPPQKPLIPKLLLAGIVLLLLSWLAFMIQYVRRAASQPHGEPPPVVRPAPPTPAPH